MNSHTLDRTLESNLTTFYTLPHIETFSAIDLPGVTHAFTLREPGIDVDTNDKSLALERLGKSHEAAVQSLGFENSALRTAEQVHGAEIAVVDNSGSEKPIMGVDGLMTSSLGVLLGIYVADCCAVYLVDRRKRGIALLHSGKKGSELGITASAITMMGDRFSIPPSDIIVQLSPCIRPPAYEIDFAEQIREQCKSSGVPAGQVHDPGTCTSHDIERYYSYRVEKGKTGRMLALLGLLE